MNIKDVYFEVTFVIVLFSILVQGFTMERLVKNSKPTKGMNL